MNDNGSELHVDLLVGFDFRSEVPIVLTAEDEQGVKEAVCQAIYNWVMNSAEGVAPQDGWTASIDIRVIHPKQLVDDGIVDLGDKEQEVFVTADTFLRQDILP